VPNNSQRVGWDIERSVGGPAVLTYVTCGPILAFNPRVIIFDNQAAVTEVLSVDGINPWKTFVAGEVFVLDLVANHGISSIYTIDVGTQFYVSTPGTGFLISVIYAR
jgi:hypothetical protein